MTAAPANLARMFGPTLLVAIVWLGVTQLAASTASDAATDRADAAAQAMRERAEATDRMSGFAAEEAAALAAVERIEMAIPPTVDVAELIELLATTAGQAGITLGTINPEANPRVAAASDPTLALPGTDPTLATGDIGRVALTVSGEGSYAGTLDFLDRLSRSDRLISITSVQLHPDGGGLNEVDFDLVLDAFTTATPASDGALVPSVSGSAAGDPLPATFEE